MNLIELQKLIQGRIAGANEAQDYNLVLDLTKRAQRLQEIVLEIEQLTRFEAPEPQSGGRPDLSKVQPSGAADDFIFVPSFVVAIRLKDRPPVYIAERHASKTLRCTMEFVAKEFGEEVMTRLASIPANRGFLSDKPERDFVNNANGAVYQNQKIRGSRFYVLTNNSTSEKLALVDLVRRGLGLSPGAFVAYTDKNMPYEVKEAVGIKM